jgi:hypothetical protein
MPDAYRLLHLVGDRSDALLEPFVFDSEGSLFVFELRLRLELPELDRDRHDGGGE